jgi:hypothetical protein
LLDPFGLFRLFSRTRVSESMIGADPPDLDCVPDPGQLASLSAQVVIGD